MADQAIAGAGAGCAGALLACPTELIKCRLQAQANMQPKGTGVLTHPGVNPIGLATLSQSAKGLASLVQGRAPSQALTRQSQAGATFMQGYAGQPGAVGRQQAAAGLAGLSQSGKGLAGLVQAGGPTKGFSTLHMGAAATSGTTPGALHLGEITVSAFTNCPRLSVCPYVCLARLQKGQCCLIYKNLYVLLLRYEELVAPCNRWIFHALLLAKQSITCHERLLTPKLAQLIRQ